MQSRKTVFVDEVRDTVIEKHGVELSMSTIYRTMTRTGYTNKTVSAIAAQRNPGNVTRERFVTFVKEHVLYKLNPWPHSRSILVMDNATIHHGEAIRELVESTGAILKYLPPYSPDLNPIEESFSAVKAFLRRNEALAVGKEARMSLIREGLARVTKEDAQGWYTSAGYE
ncbi:hypothetical protein FRC04_000605 [Tulasnella sp. 424]|nr:hypothetical protein FRC04_000605 [Tulasnella sp. 424]